MKSKHLDAFHLWILAWFLLATAPMVVAEDIRTERVHFGKGANGTVVKGSIRGYETVDYVLGASAGQQMSVTLKTSNGANYFNVLPPGSNDTAIFVGSTSGNEWTGVLPADGDYKVRVYLMRSAARRDEAASYTLTVGITGSPGASGPGHGAGQ